jgi:ribonuclease BN (tRNA processing enzyme)
MGFMSILVDDRLAIDAGNLLASLTLEEQRRVEAVLLTHMHWDHIKDLPGFAHNWWQSRSLALYCADDTREALERYMFNDVIWPSMQRKVGDYHPVVFHRVEAGKTFSLLGYEVTSVPMSHTVPTLGYLVERGGKSFFFTADTRGEGDPPWAQLRPDLLIAETTMCNEHADVADRFGHMTPRTLERELQVFHQRQGYYPRTLCVHINPHQEEQIRRELAEVATRLGAYIVGAYEDMVVEL